MTDAETPTFRPELLAEFLGRYSVDTSAEQQTMDDIPVILSSAESCVVDGFPGQFTVGPIPIGIDLHSSSLLAINRDPQLEPELFDGI